eukprot:jgi/Mesvir1/25047/Mv25740-RA.1
MFVPDLSANACAIVSNSCASAARGAPLAFAVVVTARGSQSVSQVGRH